MPEKPTSFGRSQGKPLGKSRNLIQYAALPYRLGQDEPEVLLVTSRETKRWILPKGNPKKNVPSFMVAAEEAFEEAGLKGRAQEKPFYTFDSYKRLKSGKQMPCRVRVFALAVKKEYANWPEKGERDRAWMSFAEAANNAGEAGLVLLFLELAADPELALSRLADATRKAKTKTKTKAKTKSKTKAKVKSKSDAKPKRKDAKEKKGKASAVSKSKPKAKAKTKTKAKTKAKNKPKAVGGASKARTKTKAKKKT